MTDSIWQAINLTAGIARVMTAGREGRPSPVPDNVIEWLHTDARESVEAIAHPFMIGDIVRIVDGPFDGQVGPIQGLDSNGIVCVTLQLFGQSTPAVMAVDHVEMVQSAKSRASGGKISRHMEARL